MSKVFDAIFIGIATIDTIALVQTYPAADSRTLANSLERSGGGVSATAAVAAARLGANVAFAGVVGADEEGEEIIRGLEREGVNTELVVRDGESRSATSVVIVADTTETRAIITLQQINHHKAITANLLESIKNCAIVHLDHIGYTLFADLGLSRGSGAKISLDHGNQITNFDAKLIDIYAPSDKRLLELHPGLDISEAAKKQANDASQDVIVTAGSEGSFAVMSGEFVHAPSVNVSVLSTLGAGDVFHGALVVQYLQRRNPLDALIRANAVAGLSCLGLDGRSAIPTATELEEFLNKN